jgi:hypothetical protein
MHIELLRQFQIQKVLQLVDFHTDILMVSCTLDGTGIPF